MAKPNLYRVTCNGEIVAEGTSAEMADQFHFDRCYITRMARLGMPVGSPDGKKKYIFEIVGYSDGANVYYFDEPVKPKPQPEKPKPKKKKAMTTKEIVAAARAAGQSYGYYVALNGL